MTGAAPWREALCVNTSRDHRLLMGASRRFRVNGSRSLLCRFPGLVKKLSVNHAQTRTHSPGGAEERSRADMSASQGVIRSTARAKDLPTSHADCAGNPFVAPDCGGSLLPVDRLEFDPTVGPSPRNAFDPVASPRLERQQSLLQPLLGKQQDGQPRQSPRTSRLQSVYSRRAPRAESPARRTRRQSHRTPAAGPSGKVALSGSPCQRVGPVRYAASPREPRSQTKVSMHGLPLSSATETGTCGY